MKILALCAAILFALFAGLATAVAGGLSLLVLLPLIAGALVIYDYRIGVVVLALLFPLSDSALVPRAEGLNPYTYLSAATLAGLMIKKFTGSRSIVWPPRVLLICIVLPLVAGFMLGLPHLGEGVRNMLKINPDARLDTLSYFRSYIFKPMLLVIFAVALANAVVDSKKPERFVVLFAVSALAVIGYVVTFTLSTGVGWGPHRMVISKAGMHYNEYGQLFALAFGPLLYVAFAERGAWRIFFGLAALVVFAGLVFNFARAGMLAAFVTLAVFLWQRRSPGVVLSTLGIVIVVILLAPEEWRARMLLGSEEIATSGAGDRYGELTSGRLQYWYFLVSDVARSPLYGRGLSSTLWTSAVTSGLYPSASHPHNMYLQILLDIGLLGLALVLYFFYRVLRTLRRLSGDEGIDARMRAFFGGAWAALIGMLVLGFTGGNWFPKAEQSFLWMTLGLTFAYWHRGAVKAVAASPGGVLQRPLQPAARATPGRFVLPLHRRR